MGQVVGMSATDAQADYRKLLKGGFFPLIQREDSPLGIRMATKEKMSLPREPSQLGQSERLLTLVQKTGKLQTAAAFTATCSIGDPPAKQLFLRGAGGQITAQLEEHPVAFQLVQKITHNIDIIRCDDKGAVGNTLDLAVICISHAGKKIDQPAGDVLIGRLEVEHNRPFGVQMVRDGTGIIKPLGFHENDLKLGCRIDVDNLVPLGLGSGFLCIVPVILIGRIVAGLLAIDEIHIIAVIVVPIDLIVIGNAHQIAEFLISPIVYTLPS